MDVVEDTIDNHITSLTRQFDEQNALIVTLSSRVGFLEELQDMDRCLARASCRPSTPTSRPPPVTIDLTDESEDEKHEVILVEDDDEELIRVQSRLRCKSIYVTIFTLFTHLFSTFEAPKHSFKS